MYSIINFRIKSNIKYKFDFLDREKTRRSDHNWIKTVLVSGTIADKLSANSILIQDSAIHNLKNLDALISMVKINKKRECILAIDALKEIFINHLLPNRALKTFEEVCDDHLVDYLNLL
jgi:hypothetical protein